MVPPAAHTRTPTGYTLGPTLTSLLSRPMTSQVMVVIVSDAAAARTLAAFTVLLFAGLLFSGFGPASTGAVTSVGSAAAVVATVVVATAVVVVVGARRACPTALPGGSEDDAATIGAAAVSPPTRTSTAVVSRANRMQHVLPDESVIARDDFPLVSMF